MTDPRDFDQRIGLDRRMERESGSDRVWGWVAAGAALAVLLVLVFGSSDTNQTARVDSPATTGVAPTPNMAKPPVLPEAPSTTGQQ